MADQRRELFESIFADHFDAVLKFSMARVAPDTAKDVTAETFLAAWRVVQDLPDQPRGWLLTVAGRKVADHYRAAGRRDALAASVAFQVGHSADPADGLVSHDWVRRAFAMLQSNDQELLRLLAWDGLTRGEAAQVLDCSAAVFAVRLHRARRRLRDALDTQQLSDGHQHANHSPDAAARRNL